MSLAGDTFYQLDQEQCVYNQIDTVLSLSQTSDTS